ncbi:MAG: TauD/TfdA family dioxygenase, partial [Betaproteobacteria bacterium]|nr:TauD/TfdA family dioxygenase [Betaproteobacteria bacterium]
SLSIMQTSLASTQDPISSPAMGARPALDVRRLSHAFGVEILGLDLRERQTDATIQEIRQLWNENGIVLFRAQALSVQEHLAFSRRFGELDHHESLVPFRHPEHPELLVLSTIPVNGKPSASENVGRHWHSDLSYTTRPPLGSLFHAHVLPEVGGDTVFTSMAAAYAALSDTMQSMISPLHVVHDYMGVEAMKKRDPALVAELRKANPPVAQPLVRTHEETGRPCLYLSEQMTKRIVGMTERESAPLLRFLFEHSVDPMFTYRHRWARHDLLMWDNRSTMHLALADFDAGAHRYCMRTTILGSPSGVVFEEGAAR